jgi:transcriptional regulator with XRE-family HTH domain
MNKQEEIAALAILIHDLRKHKFTLKELADRIGRSVGFLSQVERGLSRPTVADLTAISETLGVPTTYFYSLPKPKVLPWVTRRTSAARCITPAALPTSWYRRRCALRSRCSKAIWNRRQQW